MILNAFVLSMAFPTCILGVNSLPNSLEKPFLVQAAVDTARIIGLPPAKAARVHAQKVQVIDFAAGQLIEPIKPVSWRRLFFRNYFK